MAEPSPLSGFTSHMDELVQEACQLSISPSRGKKQQLRDHRRSHYYILKEQRPRPQVTLRYMQCLDGSLTVPEKHLPDLQPSPTDDNDEEEIDGAVVHFSGRIRSNHDAILIGLNTVIRDDPTLLASGPKQPRPVVLDANLEFPLTSRLMKENPRSPILFARKGLEDSTKKAALEAAGLTIFHVDFDEDEGHLDLPAVLRVLHDEMDGIRKVLVEGGVRVLESFIRKGLFDKVVVILIPRFGVGRALFQHEDGSDDLPSLTSIRYEVLGRNLIMTAEPVIKP